MAKTHPLLTELNDNRRDFDLQVDVKRYYTDIDGYVLAKTDASISNNLKVSYPIWMFHKFDKNGGWRIGQQSKPPVLGAKYYYTFDVDLHFDYWQITGNNNIRNYLKSGDTVVLFADSTTAPTILIWIVYSCPLQSYSSFVQSLGIDKLMVEMFKYQADNIDNYNESFSLNRANQVGIYFEEKYAPFTFKHRDVVSQDLIDIKLSFELNNRTGLYSYIQYNTDSISWIFKLKF